MTTEQLIEKVKEAVIEDLKANFYLTPKSSKTLDDSHIAQVVSIILNFASSEYGVSEFQVKSKVRKREFVRPRHLTWWIAKNILKNRITLGKIGFLTGDFDHATVINGIRTIDKGMDTNKKEKSEVDELYSKFISEHIKMLIDFKLIKTT